MGRRVLIVDDNVTNCRILEAQTRSWGMEPISAISPLDALGWVQQGISFDLAILDMQMPLMDGLTLAAEIRKIHGPDTLPMVMLTSIGYQVGAEAVGLAACLTKPIKASQLCDVLIRAIQPGLVSAPVVVLPPVLDPALAERHPLRILLAEDNAVNRKVALALLGRMGYEAAVAANGLEVLAALEHGVFDVILMDVQMPEMDGVEATMRVRELFPAATRPRIVALTANAMSGDRERYLAMGMDDYLSKPILAEGLVAVLTRTERRAA
jgi:CheY-like chemotaxis protein